MHEAARPYRRAADVIPMRAATFERFRTVTGTLAAEADTDGIVVYGPPIGPPSMKAYPRARWEAVKRWLKKADDDRGAVEACLAAAAALRGVAAFHCQQAVEKLLKGFLVLAGKRSCKTNSLEDLGVMALPAFPDIRDLVTAAAGWSGWAFEFRYPSERPKPEPDEAELRRALAVIDALTARLRAARPAA
jgi:HEPN domain-containing protein